MKSKRTVNSLKILSILIFIFLNCAENKINAQAVGDTFFYGYTFRVISRPGFDETGFYENGECEIIEGCRSLTSTYTIPEDGVIQYWHRDRSPDWYNVIGIADHALDGKLYHYQLIEEPWFCESTNNAPTLCFPPTLRYIGNGNFNNENGYDRICRIAIQENMNVSSSAFNNISSLKSIYCLSSVNVRQFYPNDNAYLIVSPSMLEYYRQQYLKYFANIVPYGVSVYYTKTGTTFPYYNNDVYMSGNEQITISKGEEKVINIQAFPYKLGNNVKVVTDEASAVSATYERKKKYSHEPEGKYDSQCGKCHADGDKIGIIKIRGLEKGVSYIEIYDGDVKVNSIKINVVDSYVNQIKIMPERMVLYAGESIQLAAQVTPANATQEVKYIQLTSGEQLVDESGLISIPSAWDGGIHKTIHIQAEATDGSGTKSNVLSLTICNLDYMKLEKDSVVLGTSKTQSNLLIFGSQELDDDRVVYESDDENIAKIVSIGSDNNIISGVSSGNTNINVYMKYRPGNMDKELLTTFPVEVYQSVEGISLSCYEVHVPKTGRYRIVSIPNLFPSNARNKEVGYKCGPGVYVDEYSNLIYNFNDWYNEEKKKESFVEFYSKDSPEISATCKIYAEDFENYFIDSNNLSKLKNNLLRMNTGQSLKVLPVISPEYAINRTWEFISPQPEVADINAEGLISAKSVGKALIRAITNSSGFEMIMYLTVDVGPQISSIAFDNQDYCINVGDACKINATVYPENVLNKSLIWKSDDPKIVRILDNDGNIEAISPGTAIITVSAGDGSNVSANCVVTVKPVLIESILLDTPGWKGVKGDCFQIIATIAPEDATDKTLIWTSSDESVASVDDTGMVTAVGVGECLITASAADGSGISASCEVSLEPILVESLTISPEEFLGAKGDSFMIIPTILPENADNKRLEYKSGNEGVAEVDSMGSVTVKDNGSAVITVRTTDGSDIEAECVITSVSGIDSLVTDDSSRFDVYDITGIMLRKNADKEYVRHLSKGVYIIVYGNQFIKLNLTGK